VHEREREKERKRERVGGTRGRGGGGDYRHCDQDMSKPSEPREIWRYSESEDNPNGRRSSRSSTRLRLLSWLKLIPSCASEPLVERLSQMELVRRTPTVTASHGECNFKFSGQCPPTQAPSQPCFMATTSHRPEPRATPLYAEGRGSVRHN
jgi:hypothetical protein